MCGITGFWVKPESTDATLRTLIATMTETLRHRGPDDAGVWTDAVNGAALGFRRLAIVDLSPAGHQPMTSESGRFEIIFNGEVYNFTALRQELVTLGHHFRGGSDTEVILAAVEEWGLAAAVQRFVGMFAIALWDRDLRRLHLVRDRLGIKPLYYGWFDGTFVFGSELKALAAHPAFQAEVDRDALTLYLRHGYVPSPYTIYEGVAKLPPGSMLTLRSHHERAEPETYWSAREVALAGARDPFTGSRQDAVAALDELLREAVALRMIADVPLGAFLSGGIDSSTVVALMQAQSSRPVRTFTIGFNEDGFDEATHAASVSAHLGTDHTELVVTPREARDVIPRLPWMYDEPFADSSQIPTFLVSQLARRHVTVSLSGDGGDELFGGYNRYFWGDAIWRRIGWAPRPARTIGGRALTTLSAETWDRGLLRLQPVLPGKLRQRTPGDKLHKLAEVLAVDSSEDLYLGLVSQWRKPESVVIDGREPATVLTDKARWADLPEFARRMMYLDLVSYLPDDILTKVDRASMASSLEARVPLLDHRVVEFAARLPLSMNIAHGEGKGLLRDVLYQYVPKALMERPKMGFGVPIDAWLRGPLRDWAEDLLDPSTMRQDGHFNPEPIQQKWREHLSGARNWQYHIWTVLQFQAWWRVIRIGGSFSQPDMSDMYRSEVSPVALR
ncbi:MAG: asparagine synthase (glutamine-hydrolyzing) [Thermomicrobiales bacterium]